VAGTLAGNDLAASDRKDSTKALYANLSRRHLEPTPFGAIPLDKLKPSNIDALVLAMKAKTKPAKVEDAEPVRALSDSTIRQTYTVLREGLDGAVRDGLVARNPAALVTRPGVERQEAKHLDGSGVAAVLKAAEASRYYPALVLIAATGLRKGECLALAWDPSVLNLDDGWLKVRKTVGRVDRALVFSESKT
jgi:integrase